jgi:hypothetical protein
VLQPNFIIISVLAVLDAWLKKKFGALWFHHDVSILRLFNILVGSDIFSGNVVARHWLRC